MRTEILVDGIHCAGCLGSVERALRRVEGVTEIHVDKNRKRATVEHDEKVEASLLVSSLKEIGFDARLVRTLA